MFIRQTYRFVVCTIYVMKLVQITVKSHSGYKADEYPYSFVYEDNEYIIDQVTDRWYQGETNPEFPVSDYFKAETTEGSFILKHELNSDHWFLCKSG